MKAAWQSVRKLNLAQALLIKFIKIESQLQNIKHALFRVFWAFKMRSGIAMQV